MEKKLISILCLITALTAGMTELKSMNIKSASSNQYTLNDLARAITINSSSMRAAYLNTNIHAVRKSA